MESCLICCEDSNSFFVCKNRECQMKKCCITCLKRYLLTKSSEPHCMSCKNEIPTTDFIVLFSKHWRLTVYKEHLKTILWAKELARMDEAYGMIERDNKIAIVREKQNLLGIEFTKIEDKIFDIKTKQNKMKTNKLFKSEDYINLANELAELKDQLEVLNKKRIKYYKKIREIRTQFYQNFPLNNGGTKKPRVNLYKYKCPSNECNGSLNDTFVCVSCQNKYCKDCFEILEENHTCDETLKASVQQIKKEAKPCPNCGTMISKISGCSQLFCTNTNCGTAFDWITGEIETGIIHNPEAYGYYARNPEAREAYLNRINGGENRVNNGGDNCGRVNRVTQMDISNKITQLGLPVTDGYYFSDIVTNLYNLRYYHGLMYLEENTNLDLRLRYGRNDLNEKMFKTILHMRYKKLGKKKIEKDILLTTYYVLNDLLQLVLLCNNREELKSLKEKEFKEVINYTNEALEQNAQYFGLKPLQINEIFRVVS